MDETGWRENGLKAWLWTVVGRASTLFSIRRTRSRSVVTELLGAEFGGSLAVIATRPTAIWTTIVINSAGLTCSETFR